MITSEQKGILKRYADIKLEIKGLEAEQDELNPRVLEVLVNEDIEELSTDEGKFSKMSRRKWTYTESTQDKEKALKTAKAREEQNGDATYVENFFPKFTAAKE